MRPSLIATCVALAVLALAATACNDDGNPTAPATSVIVIDAEPDFIEAPWELSGPNSYHRDGSGDITLDNIRAGAYTVEWLEVAGFGAPAAATLDVPADSTVTFTGAYQDLGEFSDSPDKLMQNVVTMYETMDPALFTKLMHPDHVTVLRQFTTNDFPDLGPTLDMTEERRIHDRMFSGQDVTDPYGAWVPGIEAITFQTFVRQGAWTTSAPTDAIPNTVFALYDVVILFDRGQNYTTLRPQGAIKFYVTHRDSTVNGYTRPFYQLRGQVDLTGSWKAAGETVSWGSVKALFR